MFVKIRLSVKLVRLSINLHRVEGHEENTHYTVYTTLYKHGQYNMLCVCHIWSILCSFLSIMHKPYHINGGDIPC